MNVRSALTVMIAGPVASIVFAQAPATPPAAPGPPATAAAGMPSVPPHGCVAPPYPGKSAANAKIQAFNASYKEYGDCIKKYVDSARTLANAAIAAGNDAVAEYNKFTEDVKKQLDADK